MANNHREAYEDVLESLRDTITAPDYIICDEKHNDTGLAVRKEYSKVGGVIVDILHVSKECLRW